MTKPQEETFTRTKVTLLLQSARWALGVTWGIHKGLLLALTTITVLHSLAPAGLAFAVRGLVNAASDLVLAGGGDSGPLLYWLSISFGITLLETIGDFATKYFNRRLHDELNLHITSDVLTHATKLDMAHFEDVRFQDMLERTQQNVAGRFSQFISKVLAVFANVVQMISLVIILATIEPLIMLVLVAIAFPYLYFQWRLAKERYQMEFNRITKQRWTRYFVMRLTGQDFVPEVKLLRLAPLLINKFKALMTEFRDHNQQVNRRVFWGSSLYATIAAVGFYLTFARVVLRVVASDLTIGDVAIFGGAMARLRQSLEQAILSTTDALEHTLYIANLQEFFALDPTLSRSSSDGIELPDCQGEVVFQDVSFTYPGTTTPVLENISLHIQPGETVAIVGRNGAGKTTLVKLIARLYDPICGTVRLDGVDVRAVSLDSLHRQLSFVFQQYGRYEATVAHNIAYGDWENLLNDQSKIEEIARLADAHRMIEKMPEGYETRLGRMFGTHTLSGGQWQKIAIARAFARDAALLILDEPTSNLDPRTEFRIFSNFRELAQGRTTILISHRFSTVSIADRILVMEKGRIVESGSHEELMALDGEYATLYALHQRRLERQA
ncbi:ABC transporter ATP-binding protein [Candidatus Leptofilum sp.]|uniref:ABC transporter ATP-binding protein n=1 Tax=Candidatus Leptofilum sp. TaxID=3241576 RepID=UPI003B5C0E49